jgi:hypothetical protein
MNVLFTACYPLPMIDRHSRRLSIEGGTGCNPIPGPLTSISIEGAGPVAATVTEIACAPSER